MNRGPSAYQPNALPLRQTGSQLRTAPTYAFYIFFNDRQPTRATGSPKRKGTLAPSLRSGVPRKVLVHRARLYGRRTGDRGYQGRCVDADSWCVCVWTVYLLCGVQGLLRPALVVCCLYLEQTLTVSSSSTVSVTSFSTPTHSTSDSSTSTVVQLPPL